MSTDNKQKLKYIELYNLINELQINPGMEDDLRNKRKKIHADVVSDINNKRQDDSIANSDSNFNDGKKPMYREFINSLLIYLDTHFPKPGLMRVNIKGELRKHLHGDEEELLRIQKKVGDVVSKEYAKFIDNVGKRVGKIAIEP